MTQQFDEGVREILSSLIILGAHLGYGAYQMSGLADKIEQQASAREAIKAIQDTDKKIDNPEFDRAAKKAISDLATSRTPQQTAGDKQYAARDRSALNVKGMYNMLVAGGLTKTAAIGVLANLKAESEFNPKAMQIGGGPGRGLAQWEKGGRFDTDRINLVKFAKSKGTKWTHGSTQIAFILYELDKHPEYKRVKKALNKAKTPGEAALIFLRDYEKAGTPHTKKRLKFAQDLAAELNPSQKALVQR